MSLPQLFWSYSVFLQHSENFCEAVKSLTRPYMPQIKGGKYSLTVCTVFIQLDTSKD